MLYYYISYYVEHTSSLSEWCHYPLFHSLVLYVNRKMLSITVIGRSCHKLTSAVTTDILLHPEHCTVFHGPETCSVLHNNSWTALREYWVYEVNKIILLQLNINKRHIVKREYWRRAHRGEVVQWCWNSPEISSGRFPESHVKEWFLDISCFR